MTKLDYGPRLRSGPFFVVMSGSNTDLKDGLGMSTPARVSHLKYEIIMLHETREHILNRRFADQFTFNALAESFCMHARNINEFFIESGSHKDLLKASSFTDSNYKLPRNTNRRKALFQKINVQMSHLTKKRTSVTRLKIGDSHREEMYTLLHADLLRFNRHLRPRLRAKWRMKFR